MLSSWVALLPVLAVFVLLGGLKKKVHVASAWSLLLGFLLAIAVWGLPLHLAVSSF